MIVPVTKLFAVSEESQSTLLINFQHRSKVPPRDARDKRTKLL